MEHRWAKHTRLELRVLLGYYQWSMTSGNLVVSEMNEPDFRYKQCSRNITRALQAARVSAVYHRRPQLLSVQGHRNSTNRRETAEDLTFPTKLQGFLIRISIVALKILRFLVVFLRPSVTFFQWFSGPFPGHGIRGFLPPILVVFCR